MSITYAPLVHHPGEVQNVSHTLRVINYHGRNVVQDVNKGSFFVYRENPTDEWKPMEKLDQDVPFDTLKRQYGLWVDEGSTTGHWPFKKTIPPDGVIQNQEVMPIQGNTEGLESTQDNNYLTYNIVDASIQKADNTGLGQWTMKILVTDARPGIQSFGI